ncbi:DUF2612 domain-containing protein [Cupriavidus gilardii]|uniref:DUF2612 domain-containing protein n=1 Tax=Cupriavidus gilardii TaxID=82541 RepID=UPI0015734892|nr:DUF2612 domain-containing protein [Cupriavidus gilardii]NSX05101.1 DUF2612 domain-containing protein [Cupriavidus gilardii]
MAQLTDYTGLITSEHNHRPKFMAVVTALAQPMVDLMNVLGSMPNKFDLDQAVGVQLDAIGLWVGISRHVSVPLTDVYFSFDIDGLGFDQGAWKGPFDPDNGLTDLDDDTYRLVIRAKIGANHWDGTMESTVAILNTIFNGDTHVFIQDNQNMTMTIGVSGRPPSAVFLALLAGGYIPLKPEGVRVDLVIVSTTDGPLFGFDVQNDLISGFDTGVWGKPL